MITFSSEDLILITGASSGIGYSTAMLCNELGARIIAVARSQEKLEALKNECCFPENMHIVTRDLSNDLESLPDFVKSLKNEHGKFSGFVHCAGYNKLFPFRDYDFQEAEEMFNLHFHSAMMLGKGVTDKRNCQKQCSLVFLSSILAVYPYRTHTLYASAKSALITASRCISKELGKQGVRANCVSPAWVKTPMTEEFVNFAGNNVLEEANAATPLGISLPQDIAETIVFLLSDKSSKITGQNIIIDGGRY